MQSPIVLVKSRLDFLDNLRIALVVLVIYHHTAIPYGGEGGWAYRSRHHEESQVLFAFNALAQTFFMATFFLLSGIFSRISLGRKGSLAFLQDKFKRLVFPAVIYTILAGLMQDASIKYFVHDQSPAFADVGHHLWDLLARPRIQGPVWYCVLLFIFDIAYLFWMRGSSILRPVKPGNARVDDGGRGSGGSATCELITRVDPQRIAYGLVLLSALEFLLRLQFPVTYVFDPLNLRFGYVPQYLAAYSLGLVVDPFEIQLLPSQLAFVLLAVSIAVLASILGLTLMQPQTWEIAQYSGGWNLAAAVYAFYNEIIGYLLMAALFDWFRSHSTTRFLALAKYTYAAFLMHAPASVTIEAALDRWRIGSLSKMLMVGTMNVLASFGVAFLIRQMPLASAFI